MTQSPAARSETAHRDHLTPEGIRAELAHWTEQNWDPELSLVEWRERLVSAGWAVPSYPADWYGRGWPPWTDEVVRDYFVHEGLVGNPVGVGMHLVAPTLLKQASEELRSRYLRRVLTGEDTWCQLFSEPSAGSDLAGLRSRAELDGGEWVVNGQKVWNTGAQHADLAMLLARTDWDVPKHAGLTFFVLPMHQPGVTVRPLRQMNGHTSFNEVFLDDARIPVNNVVGDVNGGWAVARTTLSHERGFGVQMQMPRYRDTSGRTVQEALEEAAAHLAPHSWYQQRTGRPDLLIDQARAYGVLDDPVVRDEIAKVLVLQRVSEWTSIRYKVERENGRPPGAEGSVGKLATSRLVRAAAATHSLIAGVDALLTGANAPLDGVIAEVLLSVQAQSIAGGTDEIQRNIAGEKLLGLPRDVAADSGLPFRDIPRGV